MGGVHGQVVHHLGVVRDCDGLDRAKGAIQCDDFSAKGQLPRVDPLPVGGVEGVFVGGGERLAGNRQVDDSRVVVCDGGSDEVFAGLTSRLVIGQHGVADLDLGYGDIPVSGDDDRLCVYEER